MPACCSHAGGPGFPTALQPKPIALLRTGNRAASQTCTEQRASPWLNSDRRWREMTATESVTLAADHLSLGSVRAWGPSRMAVVPKPFTDAQLAALEASNLKHLGRSEAMVRKLIGELRMARRLLELMEGGYLRMRSQLVEIDRKMLPSGRVLVVECPAEPHTRCLAETVLVSDGMLDLHTVACPVDPGHTEFDAVLAATLELPINRTPVRFKELLREASTRRRQLRHYQKSDWKTELERLSNAQATQDVLDALNELKERPDETLQPQAQDAPASQAAAQVEEPVKKPDAVPQAERPAQAEVQVHRPPRTPRGSSTEGVPW